MLFLYQMQKVTPIARNTHSLVSDQVMFNLGTTVILRDPVDLKRIARAVHLGLQFGSTGFP